MIERMRQRAFHSSGERITAADRDSPTGVRHRVEYSFAAQNAHDGLVLDLGCGIGHGVRALDPRPVVGIDRSPRLGSAERYGRFIAADMRALPFPAQQFQTVVAIHSIEHVPDPEVVLDETKRVLRPDGTAIFVTPNRLTFGRPDEIIDPYHYVEFAPSELAAITASRFHSVELYGLVGSPAFMEIYNRERVVLGRLLHLDPLGMRRLIAISFKRLLYSRILTHIRRRSTAPKHITTDDFSFCATDLDKSLDVIAVCRQPLQGSTPEVQANER